ncbi:hypothetical protein BC830DRAFT_1088017 [Chytriomyces sp. MP71]|nr:hypothetical protein BC830DRAFT_1088017 [Chytriomyces sp. MP71]
MQTIPFDLSRRKTSTHTKSTSRHCHFFDASILAICIAVVVSRHCPFFDASILAICIAVVVIYGSFWSFTLEMMLAFDNISQSTPWLANWFACALQGHSQSECAQQVQSYIPSFGVVALQNSTALIGLITTLIFGNAFIDDWKELIFKK